MDKNQKFILIKRFFKDIMKMKKMYYAAFALTIIRTSLSIVFPIILMKIIDIAIPNHNLSLLLILAVITVVLAICEGITSLSLNYIFARIGKRLSSSYRIKSMSHLLKLSGKYFTKINTGEVLTIILNDISSVEQMSSSTLFSFCSDIILAVGMLFFLAYLQFDLLLVALLLQPIAFFLQLHFQKIMNKKAEEARSVFGKRATLVQDVVSNIINYTLNNARKYFFAKYITNERKCVDKDIQVTMIHSSNTVMLNIITTLITVLILGYGGYKVTVGALSIGGLLAFYMYSQKLLGPLIRVSSLNLQLQSTLVSLKRIYGLFDESIDISDNQETNFSTLIAGKLEFNNVSFSYGRDGMIFTDLSLKCLPGKISAIIGQSGTGKSTLINLVYRLWDVNSGTITIDDKDIRDYKLRFLRKNISVISQDVYLNDDTILNNITLGSALVNQNDVIRVSKIACIYEFILSLSDGYNTFVGERGIRLSGGQKQRIAIARALLKDTQFIIFDEATSALDQETETSLIENIRNNLYNKTIIFITHRISTVINADTIYAFDEGQIIEQGTHDELLNQKGYYFKLYEKTVTNHNEGTDIITNT